MKLKKLSSFRRDNFEGKRPTLATLRKWPGVRKIGGEFFIDMDLLSDPPLTQQDTQLTETMSPARAALVARLARG